MKGAIEQAVTHLVINAEAITDFRIEQDAIYVGAEEGLGRHEPAAELTITLKLVMPGSAAQKSLKE